MANRLAREKSPYLLQHAGNPVDWHPWGEEAIARARADQKPIFLSVGYSTCHWCHVMERESFEDKEVAAFMNEHFVNVKVDREERPDVDRVYMAFVQASTGSGGWPMSVFLTPELEPFFGGTYFPPDDRYGRPGFKTLLERVSLLWRERRSALRDTGRRVLRQLAEIDRPGAPVDLDEDVLARTAQFFAQVFDREHAGFGGAPKFPRPCVHHFLLRWFARSSDEAAAQMVLATLRLMARGGMFDHLGGGFHRYSVDRTWHVPHFEKMLYDQAQLVISLLEAHLVSGDDELARVARATCDYVLRDLTLAEGGFASAEDADSLEAGGSHKAEGAFYVFTAAEIEAILGPEVGARFAAHYAIEPEGNADDPHGELGGKNVLHLIKTIDPADEALFADARAKLLAARASRPRPHLDDKVVTAWNGMMIGALARAAVVLQEPRYREAAERAARFVRDRLWDGERLLRRWRDGEAAFDAYLDDYAQLALGLVELYEATFDGAWLELAERLVEQMIARFHDPEGGGFFATSGRDPSVVLRLKDDYDGAEPAGSSVAALALLRLAELRGRPEWREIADGTVRSVSARLHEMPHALPQMLVALEQLQRPAPQIVIAGERDQAEALLRTVYGRFLPERTLILADAATRAGAGERLPWIADMAPRDGRPAAYVCREHACRQPTTDPDELARLLPEIRLP